MYLLNELETHQRMKTLTSLLYNFHSEFPVGWVKFPRISPKFNAQKKKTSILLEIKFLKLCNIMQFVKSVNIVYTFRHVRTCSLASGRLSLILVL